MNNLREEIIKAVIGAGNLKLKPEDIKDDKHFVYDYSFNSLSYQILVVNLEKSLNISIPSEDYQTGYFKSIMGLMMYLEGELYKK